jgi:DNA polymerase-1
MATEETTPQVVITVVDYATVNTTEAFEELITTLEAAKSVAFDTETTGKDARQAALVGISFSTAPGKGWYVPVGHKWDTPQLPLSDVISRLKPLFEDESIPKVAHNGKYDMTILSNYGVEVEGLNFDTIVAAYLLGEKSLGLKPLAFSKLGVEMTPITALIGSGAKQRPMSEVSVSQVAPYACADADICGQLKELLEKELEQQGLWRLFAEVEMPLLPVLFHMEKNGVALDISLLREMSLDLGKEMSKLEAEVYSCIGHRFNINSPQQLGKLLFDELKLPRARKTKSGYSTDAAVLEGLKGAHPVIELLLEYRQLTKLKSTYIDALPALINRETGRVHTNFNQTATATGRLSSSEPNLQNIPTSTEEGRNVRRAFSAQSGCRLLSADYSQIELRVLAHLCQDPELLIAFARDEDIHAATASQVFAVPISQVTPQMRRVAKTVNFGVIYGMSEYGLEQATELSRQEAASFIAAYFEKYKGINVYLDATKNQARERGYVQTILGRRRYIPEVNSANAQVRQAAERMAINMPVQGTAADIIKLAMIKLQRAMDERELRSKMILQVHDELLFEVPQDELEEMKELLLEIMPQALELSVPIKIEIKVGKNWGEMGNARAA